MKGRSDEKKPIDSNNDDVAFTPCLSEKISNTKRTELWCAFCWYGMTVRTALKYSRVVPTVFTFSVVVGGSMGEDRGGVYRVLVGKPEGKRPLGRPRRRWVDNIGMDLQEMGCGYMDWIGLAQDRDGWRTLVSAVMNLRVP